MVNMLLLFLISIPSFKMSCSQCHFTPAILKEEGIKTLYEIPDTQNVKRPYYVSLYIARVGYHNKTKDSLELSLPYEYMLIFVPHFYNARSRAEILSDGKKIKVGEFYTDFGFESINFRVGRFSLFPFRAFYRRHDPPLYAENIYIDHRFLNEIREGISAFRNGEYFGEVAILGAKNIDDMDLFLRFGAFIGNYTPTLSLLLSRGDTTSALLLLEGSYTEERMMVVADLVFNSSYLGFGGEMRYILKNWVFKGGSYILKKNNSPRTEYRMGMDYYLKIPLVIGAMLKIYDVNPLDYRGEILAHIFF